MASRCFSHARSSCKSWGIVVFTNFSVHFRSRALVCWNLKCFFLENKVRDILKNQHTLIVLINRNSNNAGESIISFCMYKGGSERLERLQKGGKRAKMGELYEVVYNKYLYICHNLEAAWENLFLTKGRCII